MICFRKHPFRVPVGVAAQINGTEDAKHTNHTHIDNTWSQIPDLTMAFAWKGEEIKYVEKTDADLIQ